MQRKHTNAPFREALGLSTSDADLQTFAEIKKNIRDIVQAYYDFDLPDSEQTDVTRAAFAAEVLLGSSVEHIVAGLIHPHSSPRICLSCT